MGKTVSIYVKNEEGFEKIRRFAELSGVSLGDYLVHCGVIGMAIRPKDAELVRVAKRLAESSGKVLEMLGFQMDSDGEGLVKVSGPGLPSEVGQACEGLIAAIKEVNDAFR